MPSRLHINRFIFQLLSAARRSGFFLVAGERRQQQQSAEMLTQLHPATFRRHGCGSGRRAGPDQVESPTPRPAMTLVDRAFQLDRKRLTSKSLRPSTCLGPSAASPSCPGAGVSSAPSPRPPASDASSRTTNDAHRHAQTLISSPSHASCPNTPLYSQRAHTAPGKVSSLQA